MQILYKRGLVMHELSYILDIINSVQEVKEKENLLEIKKIVVDVGQMSGVVPFYLHKYYDEAIKGTFLEHTELITNEVEVKILCESCGKEYTPDKENRYRCPACGERKGKLIQGKGIIIKEIVVEDDDNMHQ